MKATLVIVFCSGSMLDEYWQNHPHEYVRTLTQCFRFDSEHRTWLSQNQRSWLCIGGVLVQSKLFGWHHIETVFVFSTTSVNVMLLTCWLQAVIPWHVVDGHRRVHPATLPKQCASESRRVRQRSTMSMNWGTYSPLEDSEHASQVSMVRSPNVNCSASSGTYFREEGNKTSFQRACEVWCCQCCLTFLHGAAAGILWRCWLWYNEFRQILCRWWWPKQQHQGWADDGHVFHVHWQHEMIIRRLLQYILFQRECDHGASFQSMLTDIAPGWSAYDLTVSKHQQLGAELEAHVIKLCKRSWVVVY